MDATTYRTFAETWEALDQEHIAGLAPNPPGITPNFEIDFALPSTGRTKTFHRQAEHRGAAVLSAQNGFQWTYGFWPGDPVAVREV